MALFEEHLHFMEKALDLARLALASGEFPVGAVIAQGDSILASGSRTGTRNGLFNETEHAEMIALRSFQPSAISETAGPVRIYCTLEPCLMCFGAILLSEIDEIVYAYEDVMGGATRCDLRSLPDLYGQRDISIVADIHRSESLSLFRTYFSDPRNVYWRGSYLAEYTLASDKIASKSVKNSVEPVGK